jgi:hypothetical protein
MMQPSSATEGNLEGTKQLIPLRAAGLNTRCAWAPEPVFTLEESARLLGVRRTAIKQLRRRHPGIAEPAKVGDIPSPPFRNEFGEVRLTLCHATGADACGRTVNASWKSFFSSASQDQGVFTLPN